MEAVAGHTFELVEKRSIDQVPDEERHGKVWHQGPFWFAGAFVLASMAIGFIGPSLGLGLLWSLVAIILGMGFGTAFMALHANQGPRLGIPQMIQSRAQFGARGAIIPLAIAVFIYVAFNVFGYILAKEAVGVISSPSDWWYLLFVVVALVISAWGFDLVHAAQRYMGYLLGVIYLILTVYGIVHLGGAPAIKGVAGFHWSAFLIEFGGSAAYQISYAIYVSDYTRYLPRSVSAPKLIGWTYAGAWLGAAWMACLGALIATREKGPDPVASVAALGNSALGGFGTAVVLLSAVVLITTNAMNNYGATLTSLTAVDGFKPIRPTREARLWGVLGVSIVSFVLTRWLPGSFISDFSTFLSVTLYLIIPWTAINLTDFYWVRRGHYDVAQIFDPDGVYGLWNWRGLAAYILGFAAMVPFFNLTFYQGPVVNALGGADISFLPGLVVATGAYLVLTHRRASQPAPGAAPTLAPTPATVVGDTV